MGSMIHFGVRVTEGKKGFNITRDKYAEINLLNSLYCKLNKFAKENAYEDKQCKRYNQEWGEKYRVEVLKNYDFNMKFYSLLDRDKYDNEINEFLKKNKDFVYVDKIDDYSDCSGYYMMVLDEYCQIYIGTTKDICKRIRQHWSKSIYFDRLLFPVYDIENSRLSIDSFRALDTRRLYVYKTSKTYKNENKFINCFSDEFVCNRLEGGKVTGGLLQAITMIKSRKLD